MCWPKRPNIKERHPEARTTRKGYPLHGRGAIPDEDFDRIQRTIAGEPKKIDPLTGKGVESFAPPPDPFGLFGPRIKSSNISNVAPGYQGRALNVSDLRLGG